MYLQCWTCKSDTISVFKTPPHTAFSCVSNSAIYSDPKSEFGFVAVFSVRHDAVIDYTISVGYKGKFRSVPDAIIHAQGDRAAFVKCSIENFVV